MSNLPSPGTFIVAGYGGAGDPWGDGLVTDEVALEDVSQTVYLTRKTTTDPPKAGDQLSLEGFKLDKRGQLRAKKAKHNGSQRPGEATGGQGRDDATADSIERQTAAKAAAEMAAAIGEPGPQTLANFEALFDAVLDKIQGTGSKAQDPQNEQVPF